jgi:type I restriction enzyme S subunit
LKNRLVADVVIGKIDIRDIIIPEYEFVDEEPDGDADDTDSEEENEEQED